MFIRFENVLPLPLENEAKNNTKSSQIWECICNFEKGKSYQINANSGKGKSTFAHLIYGIRNDYKGSIYINEKDVKKNTLNDWAKLRQEKLSIVFQDLRLFPELTAEENLLAKANLTTFGKQKNYKKMTEILQIEHLLKKKTKFLSYGEKQRFAIIRALLQPFEMLILDEPFSHLDTQNIEKACQILQENCQAQGAGVLMTSLGYEYIWTLENQIIL
jgi:ABC-type lipoprotein export system ATPase subunit